MLLALPPAALFFLWLGLLLASFGAIVRVVFASGDVVSAPVIGELYPREAGATATTTLGYLSWYSTLWVELATRWLPFHRQLWEVGPWILSLAGVALVAWATAKAAGRWAGALVAFTLVCAGNRLLPIQLGSGPYHGPAAVGACILDAFLVLLVLRGGQIGSRLQHTSLCALVAMLTAAGLASDPLLYPAGLAPFLIAGVVQIWWTRRAIARRIAASTIAIGIVAGLGTKIATWAMHAVHTYAAPRSNSFANWDDLIRNATWLVQSLADLFNGDFGGQDVDARAILTFACAIALVWAVVVALHETRSQVRRMWSSPLPAGGVREAHVAFWASVVIVGSAAFVFSNSAELAGGRYLVAVGYGIVALAAVGVAQARPVAVVAGVAAACVVVCGSVVALAAGDLKSNSGHYPQQDFANFLTTFAQGEGARYGYAAYWVAPALTWETRTKLEVYPVLDCDAPHGLCTYPIHVISSWYTPRPRTRTFLVVDSRYGPRDPGAGLGGTLASVTYARYKVYLYDYDIAANLGDWRRYGVDAS